MKAQVIALALSSLVLWTSCTGARSDASEDTGQRAPKTGELPDLVAQAGVAYVAHYMDTSLHYFRTSGEEPRAVGSLELGSFAHDTTLDPIGNRLAVVHDVDRKVTLLSLHRPTAGEALEDPTVIATIDIEPAPYVARIDPYHDRLYVLTMEGSDSGEPVVESEMVIFDLRGEPTEIGRFLVPTSASLDLDPIRRLLFVYGGVTETISVFDVGDDDPVELGGSPIELREWYPEDNNWAFSLRNLTVEPWSARIYGGRPQGTLSELIALDYPSVVPAEGTRYAQLADMTQVSPVADGFDLSVDHEERPSLLEAHTALPDPSTGAVFLTARAWSGSSSTDLVTPLDADLALGPGCGDLSDPFCFYRYYSGGEAGFELMSDGEACLDATHKVVVGTTVDFLDEESEGSVVFFRYEDDLSMSPWLSESGGNLTAGIYPISLGCH